MSFGRTKIYSDAKEITAANVVEEVSNIKICYNLASFLML